jgi:hypothetical protein
VSLKWIFQIISFYYDCLGFLSDYDEGGFESYTVEKILSFKYLKKKNSRPCDYLVIQGAVQRQFQPTRYFSYN